MTANVITKIKHVKKIKAVLPNDAPKTFVGFVKMKAAKSESYRELLSDYRTVTRVEKSAESDIIKLYRKKGKIISDEKYISDRRFDELTIEARLSGAKIIRNDP